MKFNKSNLSSLTAAATVLIAAVIITIVLFVSPVVGMEDNGDFARVTYGQGLYDLPENSDVLYNGYFIKDYGIMQYYNEYQSTVFTSQFLIIQPAILLDKLLTGNDGVFDLRYLAIVLSIYFLAVLYFLVKYLSYKLSLFSSVMIALASIFVFVDIGYIAYFNSFFAEPLAYISLMACITCALLYADKRYKQNRLLIGFLINGLVLTFSKQQFAPIGFILGVLCLFFYLNSKGLLLKWFIALSSAVLMFSGVLNYLLISSEFTNINLFHSMTRGVLMTSDNPAQTLEDFGIESQYEMLNKNIYFDKYPVIDPENEMLQEDFYSQYNVFSIVKYYVANPSAFFDMLKLVSQNAYQIRPSLGNFEYSSGFAPNTQENLFSLHSSLKKIIVPKTTGFIIIWMVVAIALLYKKRLKQIIVVGLILMGLSQIVVSIIGAGDADLAKHVFLFNVAFDIVNVILFAHIVAFFERMYGEKKKKKVIAPIDIDESVYKNT